MAFVEKTGKTVEEAVIEALKELGLSQEEVKVEVLQEAKKGIFGFGRKDAIVRVSPLAVSEEPKVQEEAAPVEAAAEPNLEDAAAKLGEAVAIASNVIAKKASEAKEDLSSKANELADELTQKASEAKEQAINATISKLEDMKENKSERQPRKYAVNEESIKAAREFLQRVFKAMKIEVAMEKFVNKNDGSITFKLHGDDMGILIGKHGQTLDSLQYLTNLVANKNSSERVRVVIDVEDYRDRRIETLTRLARRLADKVKRSGERAALEPMNPHERKIIHMALQGDRKVTTLSEGDEPYRHVVIELKK